MSQLDAAIRDMTNNPWSSDPKWSSPIEAYNAQREDWIFFLAEHDPDAIDVFVDRYPARGSRAVQGLAFAVKPAEPKPDMVNHPPHYTSDPSGIECIQITRHRNFNIGSAFKYLWRNGLKDEAAMGSRAKQIEDLNKAVWYIKDEIARLESLPAEGPA